MQLSPFSSSILSSSTSEVYTEGAEQVSNEWWLLIFIASGKHCFRKGDQRRKDCYLIAACRTVTVARCVGSLLSVCICHPVYLCWPAQGIACQTEWLCVQAWLSWCIWHCCCKHWLPGLFSVTCTLYIIIHMDAKVWCNNHFIHVSKSNQFKDIFKCILYIKIWTCNVVEQTESPVRILYLWPLFKQPYVTLFGGIPQGIYKYPGGAGCLAANLFWQHYIQPPSWVHHLFYFIFISSIY